MRLILLGAPGAGKGTQAEILSEKLNIPTISTGNILRAAIKNGTEIGLKAKEYIDSGKLVPDDVIIGIIKERLAKEDCDNGYILDGVPRTIAQAKAMEDMGIKLDKVVLINCKDDTIIDRMSGRRVCSTCGRPYHIKSNPPKKEGKCDCGGDLSTRSDDKKEIVEQRLRNYHLETEPLVEFYKDRGLLVTAENKHTIPETTVEIERVLGIK